MTLPVPDHRATDCVSSSTAFASFPHGLVAELTYPLLFFPESALSRFSGRAHRVGPPASVWRRTTVRIKNSIVNHRSAHRENEQKQRKDSPVVAEFLRRVGLDRPEHTNEKEVDSQNQQQVFPLQPLYDFQLGFTRWQKTVEVSSRHLGVTCNQLPRTQQRQCDSCNC
jgi:hypothetical protein